MARRSNRQASREKGNNDRHNRMKTKAEVHVDAFSETDDQKTMIAKLSADMHSLISGVNEKVEKVEKTLEKIISENLTKYFPA